MMTDRSVAINDLDDKPFVLDFEEVKAYSRQGISKQSVGDLAGAVRRLRSRDRVKS